MNRKSATGELRSAKTGMCKTETKLASTKDGLSRRNNAAIRAMHLNPYGMSKSMIATMLFANPPRSNR